MDAFAEFEGGIAGESTRIDDSDLLAEQSTAILDEGPRHPFLHVEAGKDLGKEYVLQEGETSIGRGIDNDVILSDVSVSRRHVRVLRDGDELTLRDLGSGNGTQLNGRRAHVEVLGEGDRIELGETVLVLRIPGADIPAVEAGLATHETVSPVSGSVPLMGGAQIYGTPQGLPPMPPPGVSTDSMMTPRDGRTQSIVLPRRMLFMAAGAVAIIGSVIGAGVVTFMGRDPDPVATGLPTRVAPTVAPSVEGPTPVVVAGPPVAVPTTLLPPTVPVGAAIVAPVAVLVAEVVAPVVPTSETVAVTEAPTERPVAAERPVAEERARSGTRRAHSSTTAVVPRRGGEAAEAPSTSGRGRDGAIAAYRTADFRGAARLAREAAAANPRDRRALTQLATDIDTFAGYFPRIRSAGSNYSAVSSIGANAIQIDQRISGGHHTRAFRAGFVDWLLDEAELSFSRDPRSACRRAQSASAIEASARSRGVLSRCATRATEMLAEGRRMERTNPSGARDLFGTVVVIAAGTPTARDAQSRLDALGRTRSVDEDE